MTMWPIFFYSGKRCFFVNEFVIVVDSKEAEKLKNFLFEKKLLDDGRRIIRHQSTVEIPVKRDSLGQLGTLFTLKEQHNPIYRVYHTPLKIIENRAKRILTKKELQMLPKKWEKVGDVLILECPEELKKRKNILKIYAEILKCRAVLGKGHIVGEKREPSLQHLYGDTDTETIHIENNIKFKLDVSKLMFSPGNIDERIRMATVGNQGELVVDMFAGIGYFSVPMAVYSKVMVYAIELNPTAYFYLNENVLINNVSKRVTSLMGDCRRICPTNYADRVIMGYLRSKEFLPIAMNALRDIRGIIHYHFLCRDKEYPSKPLGELRKRADMYGRRVNLIFSKKIKSYAPHVIHGVLDAKII